MSGSRVSRPSSSVTHAVSRQRSGTERRWETWLSPEGERLADDIATAAVPADVSDSMAWLTDHGYRRVTLGVTEEVALGWASYDALAFGLVGVASLAAAVVVVDRRRPV